MLLCAAEQMASPALQCRRRSGALSRTAPADAVPRPRRKSRRPRQGSDRIRQRGEMGAREVRGRAGKKRTDLVDAVRSLHGPELRVELVAVFEERQVGDYVSPGWSLMLSRLRRARGESPPSG